MSLADSSPDSLAKKFFAITLTGVVVYIAFVLTMMSAPDKVETDRPVAQTHLAHR